jgi:hypothetical protein
MRNEAEKRVVGTMNQLLSVALKKFSGGERVNKRDSMAIIGPNKV